MAGRAAGASPSEAPTIKALIEALDPEVRATIADVDRTLISLALQRSPWDRLRSASRMAQTLARIGDAIASKAADLPALLATLCDSGVEFIMYEGS